MSIVKRLVYFLTPVACSVSGNHKIYKQDLRKLDIIFFQIKFRKLVRTGVGPPGALDWPAPQHDIFHEWNARVVECAEQSWRQIMVPEMPGTTLEISKLHCQPFQTTVG